jgi:hypothetical protein
LRTLVAVLTVALLIAFVVLVALFTRRQHRSVRRIETCCSKHQWPPADLTGDVPRSGERRH